MQCILFPILGPHLLPIHERIFVKFWKKGYLFTRGSTDVASNIHCGLMYKEQHKTCLRCTAMDDCQDPA